MSLPAFGPRERGPQADEPGRRGHGPPAAHGDRPLGRGAGTPPRVGSGDGGEVTYKVRILGAFDALLGLVAKGQFPVPMAVQIAKLSNFSQRKAFQEWQEKGLSQNAFTALVDALFAAERQQEMFAETKLTDATRAQADRLAWLHQLHGTRFVDEPAVRERL